NEAADRDQAFAHLRREIALPAERLEDIVVDRRLALVVGLENLVGYLVDLAANALENVGRTVDHGVQQVHQYGLAGDGRRTGAAELVLDDAERPRFVIAHRDQPVTGEDERDRRQLRRRGFGLAHQARRHV